MSTRRRRPPHRTPWSRLLPGVVALVVVAGILAIVAYRGGSQAPRPGSRSPPPPQRPVAEAAARYQQASALLHDAPRTGAWSLAAARFAEAATLYGEAGDPGGLGRALHQQAWCLTRDPALDRPWGEIVRLFREAAQAHEKAGDALARAISLTMLGTCLEPIQNPGGDWGGALEALDVAVTLCRAERAPRYLADALFEQAWCLQPDNNPQAADWSQAVSLYAEAAAAARTSDGSDAGSRRASAVYQQGWCLQPGNDPGGSWARALERYRTAAGLFAERGDEEGGAEAARQIGRCLCPSRNPAGDLEAAVAALDEAATGFERIGRHDDALRCVEEMARELRPEDGAGSWARAAAAYRRLAGLLEPGAERLPWALVDEALCLSEGDWARAGDTARALVERAAALLRAAGDEDNALYVEGFLE